MVKRIVYGSYGYSSYHSRQAMGEGKYDPGHFGVPHKMMRTLTDEELAKRKAELEARDGTKWEKKRGRHVGRGKPDGGRSEVGGVGKGSPGRDPGAG